MELRLFTNALQYDKLFSNSNLRTQAKLSTGVSNSNKVLNGIQFCTRVLVKHTLSEWHNEIKLLQFVENVLNFYYSEVFDILAFVSSN